MNDAELETQLDNIIDDDLDRDFLFQLLSSAKNELERIHKPLYLEDIDATKTRDAGDTYLTTKALPSDFREMRKVYVGTREYFSVPFIKRIRYKDSPRKFYINHRDSVLGICGVAGMAETITMHYLVKTPDLTQATADAGDTTLLMPSDFHDMLPFKAAEIHYFGTDAGVDDISNKLGVGAGNRYREVLHAFTNWIADQKLAEMGGRGGFADEGGTSLTDELSQM